MSSNEWDAREYEEKAGFVAHLGQAVLAWLGAAPGENILDLGCGEGVLTVLIGATGAEVVGLDSSASMVKAARLRGLEVMEADMHDFVLQRRFDAVFTNAVLHWTTDVDAVVQRVRAHLKPGGRFVGEFGSFGNVAALAVAVKAGLRLRGWEENGFRWYFPTKEEFCRVLEDGGFEVERCELIPRPTPLAAGMMAWMETFARPFVLHLPEAERREVFLIAENLLKGVLSDNEGRWQADYSRLRFQATLRPAAQG
jgi:trans-aconitate methyltransferase